MLMHTYVRGGPADAHDSWLGPYPNDADDAHDAWCVRVKTWRQGRLMLMMRSGFLTRLGTPLKRCSCGWVWGGPADAHDALLGPYPNDADDAHDAWWVPGLDLPPRPADAHDAQWVSDRA